jgi:hypothetical protein
MSSRKAEATKAATKQPSTDDIREAARLLPSISKNDINAALKIAKKRLSPKKRTALAAAIGSAFQYLFIAKLWELGLKESTAAKTAKKLSAIAAAAKRLTKALDAEQPGDARKPAYLSLTLAADAHGELIGGYRGLSPSEFVAVRDNDGKPVVSRLDYRGRDKLKEIRESVALLQEFAQAAAAREQSKVTRHKAKQKAAGKNAKAVRERDEATIRFYGDFAGAWMDAFSELPGVSRPADTGAAGGPSVRFLSTLFSALADRVSDDLEDRVPGFRKVMSPTLEAIASRINGLGKTRSPLSKNTM